MSQTRATQRSHPQLQQTRTSFNHSNEVLLLPLSVSYGEESFCNAKPESIPTINPERIDTGSIKVSLFYYIFY
jgi:hypothetical protein